MTSLVMQLTLEEAATKLGKSVRQIRYLVKEGRLSAKKVAGRWFVELEDAPKTHSQRGVEQRKQERLRAVVDDALELKPSDTQRYSVMDLKAFQLGLPLYRQADELLGEQHRATQALRQALEHLARGCHRYDKDEKAAAYRTARDSASLAVCELLITGGVASSLVRSIEQELMAALAGLLRRLDRIGKREGHRETGRLR